MTDAEAPLRAAFKVPASTTNLGPGFDSLGIALQLYNRFEARLSDAWSIEAAGEGAQSIMSQEYNLVRAAMEQVFAEAGRPDLAAHISCKNEVPVANGLGSSSTALVGGMLVARELLRQLPDVKADVIPDDARLFRLLSAAEGHPDNVAPALMGGFTLCWLEPQEHDEAPAPAPAPTPYCLPLQPACGVAVVAVSSCHELRTSKARKVLPEEVSRADAVYNLSHNGLLIAAILTGQAQALRYAMNDRLHEPYRAELIEDFAPLRQALLDAGADGACLSGAGPTMVGLILDCDDAAALARAQKVADALNQRQVFPARLPARALGIAREGALKEA